MTRTPAPALPATSDLLTALVVDDLPQWRSRIRTTLTSSNRFDVVEAANGREALALVEGDPAVSRAPLQPVAVLLDLSMPVMGGREALPLLRAVLPAAALVVLTGADLDEHVGLREAGADAVLRKGCPAQEILDVVNALTTARLATTPRHHS